MTRVSAKQLSARRAYVLVQLKKNIAQTMVIADGIGHW